MKQFETKVKGMKRFLNRVGFHTIANIAYEYEVQYSENAETMPWVSGTMYISDCSRTISLELDVGKEKDFRNTLYKLDTIIETAEKAKVDAIKMRKKYLKQQKRWTKYKKKK